MISEWVKNKIFHKYIKDAHISVSDVFEDFKLETTQYKAKRNPFKN